MECHHCKSPMTGRKRKFCTKTCGTKYAIANNPRRCEVDGCDKRHAAKGMCKTHYNDTLPNRHRTVMKTCDVCGQVCEKENRSQRYAGTYCSLKCRDDAHRKVWPTSELPDDHWARWYGKTCEWVPPVTRPTFFAGTCSDCDRPFIERAHGVPSDYCSTTCLKRAQRRRRRAREHGAEGDFKFSQIIKQLQRQDGACAYCKNLIDGMPDPEHVLPLSRGGRNDMSNLVAACRACNTDKNDLTLSEWADDRRRRGLTVLDTTLTGPAYTHLWHRAPDAPAWRHRTEVPETA